MLQQPLKSFQNQQKSLSSPDKKAQSGGAAPKKRQPIKLPAFLIKFNEYLKENFCSETEVIGVEIQLDSIKICQAKEVKEKWQIIKLASQQIVSNYSQDFLAKNKKLYSKALKEIFESNRITNKSVALSMPVTTAIIKTITLPLMTKDNLDRATRIPSFWQNLVQLTESISEYSIFYRIIKEIPESKEMDVLFVACKNSDLNLYKSIAEDAGLKVVVVDIGCFSINNLSKMKEDDDKKQAVFLKVGREENYLQVVNGGKPFIYDIFIPENEKSYLNEFLEHQTFLQRFTSQLKHIITKHEEKNPEKITQISVISSETNVDKFADVLGKRIENVKFNNSDLFESIDFPEKLIENIDGNANKSGWAVCVGLATRKLDIFTDESKQNISETVNLLPNAQDLVSSLRSLFYSKIITAIFGISSVVFILAYIVITLSGYNHAIKEINEFNSLNKNYQGLQAEFNEISRMSGDLNKLVKLKDSLITNQEVSLRAIAEISKNIPEGVWLESIENDSSGKISITGRSFEERPIITFSKNIDGNDTLLGMYIANIKTVNLENGGIIREFIILGELNMPKIEGVK